MPKALDGLMENPGECQHNPTVNGDFMRLCELQADKDMGVGGSPVRDRLTSAAPMSARTETAMRTAYAAIAYRSLASRAARASSGL